MSAVSDLELALCRLHGRRFCQLVGNGTAGLVLCQSALGLTAAKVGLPDSVCLNVPQAVLYAGNLPAYLEIDAGDLGVSRPSLGTALPQLDAVIAVHGYGAVCDMSAIETVASARGIPVIEDACLVLGGAIDGRPAGSFGMASVVSFGAGKPIDIGHGGAILTDDAALFAEIRRMAAALPECRAADEEAIDALGRRHTQLYNMHYGRDLALHTEEFRKSTLAARSHFLHGFARRHASHLEAGLAILPQTVAARRQRWEAMAVRASRLGNVLDVLPMPSGSVPWRFSLLTTRRDEAMRAMHAVGLHASSWHPRASSFLGTGAAVLPDSAEHNFAFADRIAAEVLNLWINDDVAPTYADQVIAILAQTLELAPNREPKR